MALITGRQVGFYWGQSGGGELACVREVNQVQLKQGWTELLYFEGKYHLSWRCSESCCHVFVMYDVRGALR